MELNVATAQTGHQDSFSDQTDDVLLTILSKVDLVTAVRVGVLAKRWRHLPWLLPEINLDVQDFFCGPCPDPIEEPHMDQAMASLTKATKCLLSNPRNKCTMTRLSLKIYVTGNHWCDIGPLLNNAIESKVVTELKLAIIGKKAALCKDREMRQRAEKVNGLFGACPNMFHCLTKLHITSVRFAEWDMHHLISDWFQQLQHLSLYHCDNGDCLVWEINAPTSNIKILEVYASTFERIDILCLPKLERFCCDTWINEYAPVRIGSVPSLEEVHLSCAASIYHEEFNLSEVLGATNIHTLILDFQGEKVWVQPELKQHWAILNKLKKLSLLCINVGFDLLWTTVFLEAAPSIEIFDIEIYEHPCDMDEKRINIWGEEPPEPSWEVPKFTCSNKWQLKEVRFVGFRPLEQQMSFLRVMMEQASNLKTIHLLEDVTLCVDCEALDTRHPPLGGMFPRDKDEQETIINKLRNGISSCAQIIFGSYLDTPSHM